MNTIIIILVILLILYITFGNNKKNIDYVKQTFKYKEAKKNWDFTHNAMYDKLSENAYITFDFNHKVTPNNVYFPKTLNECQEIIKSNNKIRVSGGHHTFNDISIDIDRSAENLGNTNEDYNKTLEQMKNLLERLKDKTFNNFDKNNDGVISAEEFENEVEHF